MENIKNLKCYEINEDESDIYAISLVEIPAIDSNFIYLSEQKPTYIQLESDEKRMVYGCALRADYPIYRRYEDNEFYIKFTKECVEKLSKKFLKNGYQWSWTTDHEEEALNLTVTESWIKVDAEKDKSIALGLDDVAVGSWFVGCSVDDDETWQKIKQGQWRGFSIEAQVVLNEQIIKSDMNKEINLETIETNESFWEKIKSIIKEALAPVEEVVEAPVEEVVSLEAETPVETPIEEVTEEVVELAEETPEETPEEAPVEDDELAKLREENEALKAEIEALKSQLEEKEAAEAELSKQVEKLSKMPSTEPIKVEASKNSEHPSFLDFATGKIKF